MASVQPDVINLDDLNNNGRTDGPTTGFGTRAEADADEGSRQSRLP